MNPPSVLYLVYSPTTGQFMTLQTLAAAELETKWRNSSRVDNVSDWSVEVYHRRFQ